MRMAMPNIGELVKVHLPGESPWAECLTVNDDGTWEGRIMNRLFGEMTDEERENFAARLWRGKQLPKIPRLHDFHQDQVVRFQAEETRDYRIWVPTPRAMNA